MAYTYLNSTWLALLKKKQVVKVIWHKTASLPHTDGSIVFARWRQCAHMEGHISATRRIRWTCAFSSTAESTAQTEIDRFSRFCTAHGRKSLYYTMGDPFTQNCPFSSGDRDPIYLIIPWSTPSPQSKLHHDRFSYFRTGDHRVSLYLYFTKVRPFPHQNCPFPWGSAPPSNTWFSKPTRVLNPNGISIASAVLAGLTSVTHRQTHKPRYYRPHLRT